MNLLNNKILYNYMLLFSEVSHYKSAIAYARKKSYHYAANKAGLLLLCSDLPYKTNKDKVCLFSISNNVSMPYYDDDTFNALLYCSSKEATNRIRARFNTWGLKHHVLKAQFIVVALKIEVTDSDIALFSITPTSVILK